MKKIELFIGVDISKLTIDVHALSVNKQRSEHETFLNTKSGFKKLMKWIGSCNVFVCMEHTGIYAVPLCCYLNEQQVDYTLVSALVIRKSLGLRRGKSDKADAHAIARFALRFHDELTIYKLPEQKLVELKLLVNNRERLIKARNLLKIPAREQAMFLVNIKVPKNNHAVRALTKEITAVDKLILEIIQQDQQLKNLYDLLLSIPGVGPQIAVNMIITTRCFSSFDNARKYACYCGVAPFEYSSGTSVKGRSKVSPFANKRMKSLINMGALTAKQNDPELRLYYERKTGEGKNGMLVMNAIRNKLLQRIFAVINRGTPYIKLSKHAA